MRILVTTTPGLGHLHPVVPIASALRDRGHEVLWATASDAVERVERYGFRAVAAGLTLAERGARLFELRPDMATVPPRQRRRIAFPVGFGVSAAPVMAEALRPIIGDYGPHLVLHELAELAAAPLAVARGIPHVTLGFSGALPAVILEDAADAVASLWGAEGLAPRPDAGIYEGLYVHPFPPSLGAPPPSVPLRTVRPSGFDGAGGSPPPAWLAALGRDRPLVYLTFGTEMGVRAPWPMVLEGLAQCDADVLCTTGSGVDPSALGVVPANVRVERYVPQSFVLGVASGVVSHAGAGTVLAAAAAGVPQVCLPMGADQWDNADAVAAAGAGLLVDEEQRDPAAIAHTVRRLLDEPVWAEAARKLAAEIANLADAAALVPDLEVHAGTA